MKSAIDKYATLDSSIHRWDPRIKILSLLFVIFIIGTIKTLETALAAFILAVILAAFSGLPFDFIFKRLKIVLFFLLPFFLVLPFSITGGETYHLYYLNASSTGLRLAATIFLRGVAIVTLVFPMLSTSQFEISLKALERLKVPASFIQILMFSYRYIFVFSDEMSRMNTALTSRGFKKKFNLATFKILGNFVGVLLLRSFERAERVLYAMQSRGYKGNLVTRFDYQWQTKDFIKGGMVLISGLFLLLLDRFGMNLFHAVLKLLH
ncbi:MAG: cobalt ECF transporter T component CbiQ [bacterium]